jgi:competence protein ComEC
MQFVSRAFVPVLVAFLLGVGIAAYVSISLVVVGALLLLATALLVMTMIRHDKMQLLLFGVCALAAALGMLRFMFWADAPNDSTLQSALGHSVVLRGVVNDESDVRETNTQLTVALDELVDGDTKNLVAGKALLIVDRYPEYKYGDAIEIRGTLKKPEPFSEIDGRIFDYPNYLKAKGIAYQLFRPHITVLAQGKGNVIQEKLFAAKQAFLERLARALPEPENALAGGILLGGKRSLGTEWTDRFRAIGIVHIIVLSGYNMTIVAEWLGAAFLFLGFYGSLAVSALGIICFALMTGAGATVVRAAIMALLVLLARLTGRTGTMGRALLVAGVAMVIENPSVIAFDPSFQLSFLAALGLVFVAPLLRKHVNMFRTSPFVEEVVISTSATQVMVLPLLLYQTGILSTIALFANLLVLPLIPAAMLLAFATGLLAFLGTTIAFLPALPTQALLAWILAVGKYGAALPFAAIHLPPIPGWLVALVYAVLAGFIYRSSRAAVPTLPPPVLS